MKKSAMYFALQGGGSNFGILTRYCWRFFSQGLRLSFNKFDLNTFKHGDIWGGMTVYPTRRVRTPACSTRTMTKIAEPHSFFLPLAYEALGASSKLSIRKIFENSASLTNISDTTRITCLDSLTAELKNGIQNAHRSIHSCFRGCVVSQRWLIRKIEANLRNCNAQSQRDVFGLRYNAI